MIDVMKGSGSFLYCFCTPASTVGGGGGSATAPCDLPRYTLRTPVLGPMDFEGTLCFVNRC